MGTRHFRPGEIFVTYPTIISCGTITNSPQFYMQIPDIGAKVREMLITFEQPGSMTSGSASYIFQLGEFAANKFLTEPSAATDITSAQDTVVTVPGPANNPGTTTSFPGTKKGSRMYLLITKTGAGTIASGATIRLGVFWQL